MFERFTEAARRVTVLAQEEARMLGHNYIGTEHLLLGLIRHGDGIAAMALRSSGVSLEAARVKVEELIGSDQGPPASHIPFTARAKSVFEFALRESLQLRQHLLGTEHILLGLLREGEGVACQVLADRGVDLNDLRARVLERLESAPVERDLASVPLCPNCRAVMVGNLRSTVVPVEDTSPNVLLMVVYCSSCGIAIETVIQRQSI